MEKNVLEDLLGKKRITYHFLILILTFSLLIASSLAWFVSNRTTRVNDVDMSIDFDDTSAVYQAYIYSLEDEKGIETDITKLNLNQYDTLFKEDNVYTPAFAQIKIIRTSSMSESGTLNITIDCLTEGLEDKYEYTSNVARFTAFLISSEEEREKSQDPATLYQYINSDLGKYNEAELRIGNGDPSSQTFVTVKKDAEGNYVKEETEKTNSITISVNYEASDWYDADENGTKETLNLYLYITYDVELVNYYLKCEYVDEVFGESEPDDEEPGDEGSDDEGIDSMDAGIPFANDLKKITISYVNDEPDGT